MPELDQIDGQFVYEPDGPILAEFVGDRSKVAVICGPVGSGSSTAALMRLYATACEQRPWTMAGSLFGKRVTKFFIVRPTYPELLTSTLKTWKFWFPEEVYGRINLARPMSVTIELGDMVAEFWFLALDGPDDVQKVRSTEWTGGFLNELEFQDYAIFVEARERTGRYPPQAAGGCTWSGVIGDMNAPNEDHFIARMAGWAEYPEDTPLDKRIAWPSDWWLKKQPAGLIEVFGPDGKSVTGYLENPRAENAKWLEKGYYLDKAKGATKQHIDSRIMNRVSFLTAGDPVWPNFKPEWHMTDQPLPYVPGREVDCALDFGRRPCAIFAQEIGDRIQVQREFRRYGMTSSEFCPLLKRFIETEYRGARIRFTGDPKGQDRGQAVDRTSYEIFASYGMTITPAPVRNNNLPDRLEAVSYALQTNRILVSRPGCSSLAAALSGKYVWEQITKGDKEPLKDKYSDVADCLQYLCLFLGEGRKMVGLETLRPAQPARVAKFRSMRRVML